MTNVQEVDCKRRDEELWRFETSKSVFRIFTVLDKALTFKVIVLGSAYGNNELVN